jgi:hypothetical protein
MEKPPTVYIPIRLPHRAVAKLDLLAAQWLCATRSEAIRRLIADATAFEALVDDKDAPQLDSEAA